MNNGLTGFERAVAGALDQLKVGLLGSPQEFTGAVADLYDPDSAEVTVLYLHCTGELLRPFSEAARAGTADALEVAAKKAELWLRDVRRVNDGDARAVAWGIARGLAAHLGVGLGRDDATRVAVERARAVLADSGATEADVAGALAAVRALPAGTQGRAALEAALERRLEKLRAEREARRRAEEERLRREAEERQRREAEERARAEAARRRQEAEEREARRRAATQGGHAPNPDPDPKPQPDPMRRGVGIVIAVIALVVAVALLANSNSWIQGRNAPNSTSVVEKERDEPSVFVREDVSEYSWAELKELSKAIAAADSDKEGLKIAKKYNLVDSDGKLRGDTKAVTLTDGTKTSVRILGFRHDELAGGGKAGITFEFADVPAKHSMNAKSTNSGGWEASEMREWLNSDFLALLPDDLRGCVEPAAKRTNNAGHVSNEGDTSVVTGTSDRLWLLSMGEVYGKVPSDWYSAATRDAEGTQYQLYADQGVTTSDQGVTTSNYDFCKKGANSWWWLRSPLAGDDDRFMRVIKDGHWSNDNAGNVYGVSPGFCF